MNERDQNTLPDLDEELKLLAEDVPEMPSDFHTRWTSALRAEIMRDSETADESSFIVDEVHAAVKDDSVEENVVKENQVPEEPEEETRHEAGIADIRSARSGMSRQWKRLLGVAAVFVFLIGGTLLTRDSLRPAVRIPAEPAAVTVSATSLPEIVISGETAEEASGSAAASAVSAPQLDYAMESAAEETVDSAAEDSSESMFIPDDNLGMKASVPESSDSGYASGEENVITGGAGSSESSADDSGTADSEYQAEECTEGVLGSTPEKNGILLFFEDMGRFVLASLPYLAAAAAAALIIFLIRRKRIAGGSK